MDKISLKIKRLYPTMSKAEKRIAQWIEDNGAHIISLSIVEMAEKCAVSEATIVRFSKHLGLSGFQELKLALAAVGGGEKVSTHIQKDDDPFTVFEKVSNDIYLSLEKTRIVLSPESLNASSKALCSAGKIALFGLGNSASVANDGAHKFLRAGLNAVAYSDNHMQVIAASHLKKGDVAVGISHSGSSKDIIDALNIARNQGATTIAITNEGKSPVLKVADIVLFTSAEETRHNILGLTSRLTQLAIIDALYFSIVYNRSEAALESIRQTETALQTKKF